MTSPRITMLFKPDFPTELITEILTTLWLSLTLSNSERIHLLTTLPCVSRLFYHTFLTISFRDVYITSAAHASYFLYVMQSRQAFIYNNRGDLVAPHELCRSLSFQLVNEGVHPPVSQTLPSIEHFDWSRYTNDTSEEVEPLRTDKSAWDTTSDMLYMLASVHPVQALPNLRRISILSMDYLFSDIFTNYVFSSFPKQVDTLELEFAFSLSMPPFLVKALKEKEDEDAWVRRHIMLSNVRQLVIRGAGLHFVQDMLNVCRNVRRVVTDVSLEGTKGFTIAR